MLIELCPSFSCSHNIKISVYFSSRLQVLTSFLSQSFVWLETSFHVFSNPEKSFSRSIVKFVLCFVQALWRVDWLTDFVTYHFECLQHLLLLVFFCRNNCGFVQCFWENAFGFVGCEILRLLELLRMLSYLALSIYSSSVGLVWLPVLASNICPILQTRLWIVSLSLDCLFLFGIAFFKDSHKKYRAKFSTKSYSEPSLKLMVFCDFSCSISLFMLGLRWPTAVDTSKCSKPYEHRCYKIRYFARLPGFILLWSKLRGCCFFIFGDCEGGK